MLTDLKAPNRPLPSCDLWPDPTPEMVASPQFEAVWQCIKGWDIGVADVYAGYCGATGNHVRAILEAIASTRKPMEDEIAVAEALKDSVPGLVAPEAWPWLTMARAAMKVLQAGQRGAPNF